MRPGFLPSAKFSFTSSNLFRAIRKDKFFELGGFDPKYGYADDQTFWLKYGIRPIVATNTTCYHKNPETLRATYKQARWIGASWKQRFILFRIPVLSHLAVLTLFLLLPVMIIFKSMVVRLKTKFSCKDLIKYYSCKFTGYAVGTFKAVWLGKIWK